MLNSNRMTVIDRIQTSDPTTLAMSPNLNLQPGTLAVAVVKATTVIVETPGGSS